MKLKELIKILQSYDENYEVNVIGGETSSGSWAQLQIGTMEIYNNNTFFNPVVAVLEYEE
jgi:hypothetical protein